jgi:hypothetical protein
MTVNLNVISLYDISIVGEIEVTLDPKASYITRILTSCFTSSIINQLQEM